MATRCNRAELASRRGTTKQAMGGLLKRHGIRPGPDGKFDPVEVDRILDGDQESSADGMTLTEAIRRKESALARLRELELEMRSGKFVDTDFAIDQHIRLISCLRAIVLTLPTRALGRVAGDQIKRPLYAAAVEVRNEILRQLGGATKYGPDQTLCPACTAKVEKAASKFRFPDEAFPKGVKQFKSDKGAIRDEKTE